MGQTGAILRQNIANASKTAFQQQNLRVRADWVTAIIDLLEYFTVSVDNGAFKWSTVLRIQSTKENRAFRDPIEDTECRNHKTSAQQIQGYGFHERKWSQLKLEIYQRKKQNRNIDNFVRRKQWRTWLKRFAASPIRLYSAKLQAFPAKSDTTDVSSWYM